MAHAPSHLFQWDQKGRWSLRLDMSQPFGRDMQMRDVQAGAYYRVTPSLRVGGGGHLRRSAVTAQPHRPAAGPGAAGQAGNQLQVLIRIHRQASTAASPRAPVCGQPGAVVSFTPPRAITGVAAPRIRAAKRIGPSGAPAEGLRLANTAETTSRPGPGASRARSRAGRARRR